MGPGNGERGERVGASARLKFDVSGMIYKPESTNNFRHITGYGAAP